MNGWKNLKWLFYEVFDEFNCVEIEDWLRRIGDFDVSQYYVFLCEANQTGRL